MRPSLAAARLRSMAIVTKNNLKDKAVEQNQLFAKYKYISNKSNKPVHALA
ncbi:hypothetical protein BRO54_3570 [Geobacillus proteiniphilus]|uniref:Uncharacterized protein n=1 Tax=Geobacillus proteiniphilus TaxID=860353 RepID=A0A1Q5SL06_9BACL|nr:hypothetical protein BRO54_3570 [Geobacillus proteiniphilus]